MTRLNLFFMLLYALVSSALHYAVNKEEKLMEELKEVIHFHEASVDEEGEKESEEEINKQIYSCSEHEHSNRSLKEAI